MIEAAVFVGVFASTIIVVLSLLSARMNATSHPTEEDMRFLISSTPGESLIDYRACNALIAGAVADLPISSLNRIVGRSGVAAVLTSLNWVSSLMGGLWVGGRVFLTSHRLVFMPNAMNSAVHRALRLITVDLKDIAAVTDRFGIVTRIIDIETSFGVLSVRAHNARAFADQLRTRLVRHEPR